MELKDGSEIQDARLDRLVSFDERSRSYRAVQRFGIEENAIRSYTWNFLEYPNVFLDQGQEGACCGFAWSHELLCRPAEIYMANADARAVYHRAQLLDVWPGGSYSGASPIYEGTSVLAGAKAVQERLNGAGESVMPAYYWTFSTEELVRVLGYRGCAVLGLNWYSAMGTADEKGFIHKEGYHVGGHAILARGFRAVWRKGVSGPSWNNLDLEKSYVLLRNSWSRGWGLEGDCKINLLDLDALLREEGESCVPSIRNK